MKKNITINLCGRLFQIDEDAYEMLQHYIDSLRHSFGKREGGEEIVDDIEVRIAELFDELRQQGIEAITIVHVKDIITRIGKPEELTGEEETSNNERTGHRYDSARSAAQGTYDNVHSRTAGKKLFRNPKDKMLAGVLSGFAAYTNTDPVIWRLLTVLFTLFYGIGLVAYIVLAIIVPEARTPEQMLQMEGKEVTPQNLADVVVEKNETARKHPNLLRTFFSLLLKILFGIFVAMALVACVFLCIGALFLLLMIVCTIVLPVTSMEVFGLPQPYQGNPIILVLFFIALLMLLVIPIYAIIHMVLSLAGRTQPMSIGQRTLWIILWVLALCCVVPCGIAINQRSNQYFPQKHVNVNVNARHTHCKYQGVMMSADDKNFLEKGGWNLITARNCKHITWSGLHPTGNKGIRYLDTYNRNRKAVLQVERKQNVEPGVYRMDCLVRAEGPGAYVYATAADSTYLMEIPAYEHEPAGLYELLRQEFENGKDRVASLKYLNLKVDTTDYRNHAAWLDSWSIVTIENIVSTDGSITYGMTNDATITGRRCRSQWFCATDFTLTRTGDLPKSEKR